MEICKGGGFLWAVQGRLAFSKWVLPSCARYMWKGGQECFFCREGAWFPPRLSKRSDLPLPPKPWTRGFSNAQNWLYSKGKGNSLCPDGLMTLPRRVPLPQADVVRKVTKMKNKRANQLSYSIYCILCKLHQLSMSAGSAASELTNCRLKIFGEKLCLWCICTDLFLVTIL